MSTAPSPAGPGRPIPAVGARESLRVLLGGREERVDMLSRLQRYHRRHGPVVLQRIGPMKMVYLEGPDANRTVLLDRERIFSARLPWTQIMGRIFPGGLLLRDGEEHKHHRKIMHTAFTRPALREYVERMNPMIDARLDAWEAGGRTLQAFRALKELTLDMAATIFVGIDLGPDTRRMNEAFENLVAASMSRVRLRIPGLEFHRGLQSREFMIRYLRGLLEKKRADEGLDMFGRLSRAETEEGDRFGDQEVIDHMIFLMMAAHDTTTSTLCSLAYELARNPDWQERVREECAALGHEDFGLGDMDRNDPVPSLTFAMKETLRRYPPLPVIPRVATRAFRTGDHVVPEGAMAVISPIHTHHMPEWWTDPYRFDPERFAPGRAEHERHTHSWIPFGGGPHMCLGFRFAEMQIKAIVHKWVRRFRWSVPPGYVMPVQQAPISRPMDGLPLHLERLPG